VLKNANYRWEQLASISSGGVAIVCVKHDSAMLLVKGMVQSLFSGTAFQWLQQRYRASKRPKLSEFEHGN
jgi:hypothetical protein